MRKNGATFAGLRRRSRKISQAFKRVPSFGAIGKEPWEKAGRHLPELTVVWMLPDSLQESEITSVEATLDRCERGNPVPRLEPEPVDLANDLDDAGRNRRIFPWQWR